MVSEIGGMTTTCMEPDDAHTQVRHLPSFGRILTIHRNMLALPSYVGKRRVQNTHFYLVRWHLAFFSFYLGQYVKNFQ